MILKVYLVLYLCLVISATIYGLVKKRIPIETVLGLCLELPVYYFALAYVFGV